MVTGPTLPIEVLLELTSVNDSEPALHPAGIEPSAIDVTTSSTTVQEIVMPLSDPHELTLTVAPTTFFDVGLRPAPAALPGTASIAAVTAANASPARIVGYPVIATETPVTAEAAMLLELKSGEAAPAASSEPVISPSDALPAPVRVTL